MGKNIKAYVAYAAAMVMAMASNVHKSYSNPVYDSYSTGYDGADFQNHYMRRNKSCLYDVAYKYKRIRHSIDQIRYRRMNWKK